MGTRQHTDPLPGLGLQARRRQALCQACSSLSSPVPPEGLWVLAQTRCRQAGPELTSPLHPTQPPGPETRHRGRRLQTRGSGGQRRGLQVNSPCPWRQSRPAAGQGGESPSHPTGSREAEPPQGPPTSRATPRRCPARFCPERSGQAGSARPVSRSYPTLGRLALRDSRPQPGRYPADPGAALPPGLTLPGPQPSAVGRVTALTARVRPERHQHEVVREPRHGEGRGRTPRLGDARTARSWPGPGLGPRTPDAPGPLRGGGPGSRRHLPSQPARPAAPCACATSLRPHCGRSPEQRSLIGPEVRTQFPGAGLCPLPPSSGDSDGSSGGSAAGAAGFWAPLAVAVPTRTVRSDAAPGSSWSGVLGLPGSLPCRCSSGRRLVGPALPTGFPNPMD